MKVGFGQASISPKGGSIVIAGSLFCRYVSEVNDDIKANAMVIEDNGKRTIWVCCDMCHPTSKLTNQAAETLKNCVPDFKAEELIMSATHATPYCFITDDEYTCSGLIVDYSKFCH